MQWQIDLDPCWNQSGSETLFEVNFYEIISDRVGTIAQVVVGKLLELPAFKAASRLSLYLNMSDEVQTIPLLRHSLDSGRGSSRTDSPQTSYATEFVRGTPWSVILYYMKEMFHEVFPDLF